MGRLKRLKQNLEHGYLLPTKVIDTKHGKKNQRLISRVRIIVKMKMSMILLQKEAIQLTEDQHFPRGL